MAQKNNYEPAAVSFDSEGDKIAGKFYEAIGNGLKPTAILLHGHPGGDGDLFGLGQKLRIEGINALVFNYRGTWQSEGIWLPTTSLQSVRSAIKFLKSSEICQKYSVDTTNLYMIGYSYGGGMALLGSLFDKDVNKVVSIAGGSLKVVAENIEKSDEYRLMHRQFLDDCLADSRAVRGLSGEECHNWLLPRKDDYDIVKHARELSVKKIFLIGGSKDQSIPIDEHIQPLYEALNKYAPQNVKFEVYDCDHSLEGAKDQIIRDIADWLKD